MNQQSSTSLPLGSVKWDMLDQAPRTRLLWGHQYWLTKWSCYSSKAEAKVECSVDTNIRQWISLLEAGVLRDKWLQEYGIYQRYKLCPMRQRS